MARSTKYNNDYRKETTPTTTDVEGPPTTPTKRSTRQTRSSRSRKDEASSLVTKSPPAASSDRDLESDASDDDAAEVESTPIARNFRPSLPPSSDDFGGY